MSDQPRHILVVSCLIRDAEERVLLVKHHLRGWELPQGRVEEGEGLIFALSREALEETGVTISHARLVQIWSKLSHPAALVFCFLARHAAGEPTPSVETPCVEWCVENEVLERVSHPVNRDRIGALLAHDGQMKYRSYTTGPYRLIS